MIIPGIIASVPVASPHPTELLTDSTFDSDLTSWTYNGSHFRWATGGYCEKYGTGDDQLCIQGITLTSGHTYLITAVVYSRSLAPGFAYNGAYMATADGHIQSYGGGCYDDGGSLCFDVGSNTITWLADGAETNFGTGGFNGKSFLHSFSIVDIT